MPKSLKNKLKKSDDFCYKHFKKLLFGLILITVILSILLEGITVHIFPLSLVLGYFLLKYVQKNLKAYKAKKLIREKKN